MKKYVLSIFIMFLLAGIACQKKTDFQKEIETIKALITNESQAYMQKDTAKLFSYYIHDDNQTRLTMQCDTFQLYRGWEKISSLLGNADFTGYSNIKNTKDFINIKVMNGTAWAIYKDIWSADKEGTPMKNTLFCTMILEKKASDWKISGFSFYASRN